jgi:hypothetical protein
MRLRILHVVDCPNVGILRERLCHLLAGRQDVEIVSEVVASDAVAAAAGMTGSVTLLIDGVDPFAAQEPVATLSCRLYRDENGRLDRAPSLAQLHRALEAGGRAVGASSLSPAQRSPLGEVPVGPRRVRRGLR